MALAVASTSSVTTNNAATLTLTKATGVASGDLLLIIASKFQDSAITISGFTEILPVPNTVGGDTAERQLYLSMFYRIADASDVAAANYSINVGGGDDGGCACMLRVTGWTSGNPIYSSANTTGTFATVGGPSSLSQSSLTLTRPSGQLLIQAYALNNTDGGTSIFSFSNYSITSSDSNPSWTEVRDAGATVNQGNDTATNHLAVAYAITTDTSTITAYGADFTESTSDNTGFGQFLAVLCEPSSATGTNALLEVSPTIFTNAGVEVGGTGTNALLQPTPQIFSQSGEALQPTTWTTITKS